MSALLCSTLVVYLEARSEPIEGQRAVAIVLANRAKWETKNVCKEALKPKAFSSFNNIRSVRITDNEAFIKALWISSDVLDTPEKYMYKGKLNGVKFYHTKKCKVYWDKDAVKVATIGNHYFYKGVS